MFLVRLPEGYPLADESDSELSGLELSYVPTSVLDLGVASEVTVPSCDDVASKEAMVAKKKKKVNPEMSHYRTHKRRRRLTSIVRRRVRPKTGESGIDVGAPPTASCCKSFLKHFHFR